VRDSRFARNVVHLASANAMAALLPVLAAPLLTRLYTPADFGTLALCLSILAIGLAVGTGRFEWSVPSAPDDRRATCLLVLGGVVISTIGLLWLLAWVCFRDEMSAAWPALGPVAWLLPACLMGGGFQQLLQAWHVRCAELSGVGRSKMVQSAGNVGISLALAPLSTQAAGAWCLVVAHLVGIWLGLATLLRSTNGLSAALRALRWRRLALAWKRHRCEAAWSTIASAANAASFALIPLLLSRHYSIAEVGYYALMSRIALAPTALIAAAISQSFWAESAQLLRSDVQALGRMYWRGTVRLACLALPLALLTLMGPWYTGWIFGAADWSGAGWVLACCTPMLVGVAVGSSLSHLVIHGKQHWQALWDLGRIVLVCTVIEVMGQARQALPWTVLALSTVMGCMYMALIWLNVRALKAAGSR